MLQIIVVYYIKLVTYIKQNYYTHKILWQYKFRNQGRW